LSILSLLNIANIHARKATLKLQGADAQNHAVYNELKRVQQYFGKIKKIEEPEAERSTSVNQEAAARMLKADLVGFSQPSSMLLEESCD
jgi:exosome complex protein LRP1